MEDFIFGANILENLTTGMYKDSKVIYREYIQNACDQIDKAISLGLLEKNEGLITISLDSSKRSIVIEDNATGINQKNFEWTLGHIANSDKTLGEDKGFRGIGRLCGLAYCKELVFSTTAYGEDVISIMRCDATKMKKLLLDNIQGKKQTANEVLKQIYSFSYKKTDEVKEHWFKVELIGINDENSDLLDKNEIKKYLSFVAPVPYQSSFYSYSPMITQHAYELGCKLDTYDIILEDERIFKPYKSVFNTGKGEDKIYQLYFKDIYNSKKELLAWLWIGISKFKAAITNDCPMRGLRIRKENIQIGNNDALQKLFKEDRGNNYFIGEVFVVSKDLIPNSQRDYFNENPTRVEFERKLKEFFGELYKVYYDGSSINSDINTIKTYIEKKNDFFRKKQNHGFTDAQHIKDEEQKLEDLKAKAEKANNNLKRKQVRATVDPSSLISSVYKRREEDINSIWANDNGEKLKEDVDVYSPETSTTPYRVDKSLSSLSKSDRKLVSKIFAIIRSVVDAKLAETIIEKIENELQPGKK